MDATLDLFLSYGLPLLALLLCAVAWATSVFSLPGNWIALLLALLFGWAEGFEAVAWWVLLLGALLAGLGELAEFLGGWHGARRSGGSKWTGVAAILGSIAGALFGAAFGYGLGAIPGTVLGAFAGALVAEALQNQEAGNAFRRGVWAGVGRAFGLAAKLGFGAAFLAVLSVRVIWKLIAG